MASGKLLVLLGEECKKQADYHNLDKEYLVTALIGVASDSGDVLGVVEQSNQGTPLTKGEWDHSSQALVGEVTLPYPHYSSRTVEGIPLHTWAVAGKIDSITIPTRSSTIHDIRVVGVTQKTRLEVTGNALAKIDLLPPVTDPKKSLGNDFRRPLVRDSWHRFKTNESPDDLFTLVEFYCVCSSGTYMRTLCDELAKRAGTHGLAFSIHRTRIGRFIDGHWTQEYL